MTEITKRYNEVVVVGPNSSIANYVLGALRVDKTKLFGIYNHNLDSPSLKYFLESNLVSFKLVGESPADVCNFLSLDLQKNVLILNFSGELGPINSFIDANSIEILETINRNFESFIFSSKILCLYGPNSLLISFCGAGVGGGNLDDSSLGYLAAKSGIVILNEALDGQLKNFGHRLCLISPGAYPSNMQRAVAEAPQESVDDSRRNQAKHTLEVGAKHPEKILEILDYLILNPDAAGGRLWSAHFDNEKSLSVNQEFGKMRRIF